MYDCGERKAPHFFGTNDATVTSVKFDLSGTGAKKVTFYL
jgi:hypothetical protein